MRRRTVLTGLLSAPLRNLLYAVLAVLTVGGLSTIAYLRAGWSLADAAYMVTLTIFTVGYGEVRPIDTGYLHAVTMATMILGCTGVIVVTGALVQVLTLNQLEQFFGKRVEKDIERLDGHVIICGFGRIGMQLASELAAAGAKLVVIERDEPRFQQARELGYLCRHDDATDEAALKAVHVERAKVVATVLADDASNVFITLSARSLNPGLQIIARGERPSTERKLLQAGADKVVLPTHIGAERIAELILYSDTGRTMRGQRDEAAMAAALEGLGLDIEVMVTPADLPGESLTVGQIEQRGGGALLVVRVSHANGRVVDRPALDHPIGPGDGVTVISKRGRGTWATLFDAPAAPAA